MSTEDEDAQRRAVEVQNQIEANRERMRRRQEREEEERKRREGKAAAEEEQWRQKKQQYAQEQQQKYDKEKELQRKKQAEQEQQLRRLQEHVGVLAPGWEPDLPTGATVAARMAAWGAKAKALQKRESARRRKEEELERQWAAVSANMEKSSSKQGISTAVEEDEKAPRQAKGKAAPAPSSPSDSSVMAGCPAAARSSRARAPIGPARAPIGPTAIADVREGAANGQEEERSTSMQSSCAAGVSAPSVAAREGADCGKGVASAESQPNRKGCQKRQSQPKKRWWSKLDGDCPISLAPLCDLPVPPFALDSQGSDNKHYFDAQFLANWLLSSCDFIDPFNRRPLTLDECEALDAHVRRHHPDEPGQASVADTFQLFHRHGHIARDSPVYTVQREATSVLQNLFRFHSLRRTDQRGHAIAHAEGSLTVVDDDDILTAGPARQSAAPAEVAPALEGGGSEAASGSGGWGHGSSRGPPPLTTEEAFPTLPGAKANAKAKAPAPKAASKAASSGRAGARGGGRGGKGAGNKYVNPSRPRGWGTPV